MIQQVIAVAIISGAAFGASAPTPAKVAAALAHMKFRPGQCVRLAAYGPSNQGILAGVRIDALGFLDGDRSPGYKTKAIIKNEITKLTKYFEAEALDSVGELVTCPREQRINK